MKCIYVTYLTAVSVLRRVRLSRRMIRGLVGGLGRGSVGGLGRGSVVVVMVDVHGLPRGVVGWLGGAVGGAGGAVARGGGGVAGGGGAVAVVGHRQGAGQHGEQQGELKV